MSDIGLFYVGAVLIVNGVMLLGLITPRAAAPLNLFVGAMQVFTPTYLVLGSGGEPAAVLDASALYLFGFTYLWVGINALTALPGHGLGWFSLFVAAAAVGFGFDSLRGGAPVFGLIWWAWALLWALFFVVLALDRARLARLTGALAVVEGALTAAIPAWVSLHGGWNESWWVALTGLGVGAVATVLLWRLAERRIPAAPAITAPA